MSEEPQKDYFSEVLKKWLNRGLYSDVSKCHKTALIKRDKDVNEQLIEILRRDGYGDRSYISRKLSEIFEKEVSHINEDKKQKPQNAHKFCSFLLKAGLNFVAGVPDGTQKYIIKELTNDQAIKHIQAVRESEAIGIAAGASLSGKQSAVYMQNSGLLDSVNDITSLSIESKIPLLFLVGLRGAPGEDAPHHFINGRTTINVLNDIGVYSSILTKDNMEYVVSSSVRWMNEKRLPAAILIMRSAFK